MDKMLTHFQAHFQCLVNLCSAKSYGRAVVYSISICSATGANIIPLHPIEVRQSQSRKRGRLEEEASDSFTAIGRDFDLARNLAMALTCNAGEDGLVTVSLGAFEPSATTSILKNEDKTGHSPSTRKWRVIFDLCHSCISHQLTTFCSDPVS